MRIKDIAQQAGVSIGTVDRVLHNRGEVSEKTKERVLQIIKESGYRPNLFARSLASKKKLQLTAIIPKAKRHEYWEIPLAGINKAASEISAYNCELNIVFYELSDAADYLRVLQQFQESPTKGLILAPLFKSESKDFVRYCKSQNIPVAYIDTNIEDSPSLTYIGQDAFQSGRQAALMLNHGQSKQATFWIIHFSSDSHVKSHQRDREKGFRAYMEENAPLAKIININAQIDSPEDLLQKAKQSLANSPIPNGIYVPNSNSKIVCKVLKQLNVKTQLLGYDLTVPNIELLKSKQINFLISQRPKMQGYKAVLTVFEHLHQQKEIQANNFMPIEILTPENIEYYLDFEW